MTDAGLTTTSHTSEARLALAASLRRLGNALVAHQPDDEVLTEITRRVDEELPAVEAAPEREHSLLARRATLFASTMPEGVDAIRPTAFADCVVSGRANPMGIGARLWREGDEAVCQVVLGAA